MNEKNHKAIAEIIKDNYCGEPDIFIIIEQLADYFEKENPPYTSYFKKYGFDKDQFITDCGAKK